MEKLNKTVKYASHNVCRRRQLLEYFGENYSIDNCGACDICMGNVEKIDITTDSQMIMSAISRTGQYFGIKHIIDVVAGADTKRIRELNHNEIKTYGVGKNKEKKHWHFIVDELLAQEAITQNGGQYPVLVLTKKGTDILLGREKIEGLKREEVQKKPKAFKVSGFESYDEMLFGKLRVLRKRLAEEHMVPPYIIFSDMTLHEMCIYYPSTLNDMRMISGVGDTKLERYGADFTMEITAHLNENPNIVIPERKSVALPVNTSQPRVKGGTIEKTYELFKEGLSIKDIAKARNLATSTITGHLESLIRNDRDIEIDRLIDPAKRNTIEELFLTFKTWNTGPIVEHSKGTISYDEAKLVRANIQK
ncbi:MAG: DNA helicase RecQ, partial [Gammaproteobacteria bacterium]|nr:DNA helicase RecQ [Gammaproteobacteria bacterium]